MNFYLDQIQEKIHYLEDLFGQSIYRRNLLLVDELFGSGDLYENATFSDENIELHMSSSIESLARLFRREKEFIQSLKMNSDSYLQAPFFPANANEIMEANIGKIIPKVK